MAYTDHFDLADKLIAHLDALGADKADPLDQARYASFLSVSATTVYELAVKEVFFDFAHKKHKRFGAFVEAHFKRINGRIRTRDLKGNHIPMFGEVYLNRYKKYEEKAERDFLESNGVSIRSSYNNLIQWRNEFAHQGKIITTATYSEVNGAYEAGKRILECLARTMVR